MVVGTADKVYELLDTEKGVAVADRSCTEVKIVLHLVYPGLMFCSEEQKSLCGFQYAIVACASLYGVLQQQSDRCFVSLERQVVTRLHMLIPNSCILPYLTFKTVGI